MKTDDKQLPDPDDSAQPPDMPPCAHARFILEKFKRESAEYLKWIKSFQGEEDSGDHSPSI